MLNRRCGSASLRSSSGPSVSAPVSHTPVEAFLLETALALAVDERPAARRALQTALTALTAAEPLDALRPFAHVGAGVHALLALQHGSFGGADAFAQRAVCAGGAEPTMLSQWELTVLGLLPSLLSLDEIADDLTVSVNTVKSHVRSIYTKLGVSSRGWPFSPPTSAGYSPVAPL
jgi:LuxR family maltose regulon positive regulatory protein